MRSNIPSYLLLLSMSPFACSFLCVSTRIFCCLWVFLLFVVQDKFDFVDYYPVFVSEGSELKLWRLLKEQRLILS